MNAIVSSTTSAALDVPATNLSEFRTSVSGMERDSAMNAPSAKPVPMMIAIMLFTVLAVLYLSVLAGAFALGRIMSLRDVGLNTSQRVRFYMGWGTVA